MPVEGPLPKTGDQHDINADADRCLRGRCPRHWRVQSLEGTDDYGYDYQVQTTPGQQATDIFRIQLKGTRSPQISADNSFISISLSASTIRYYDRAVEPVLLVICDLSVDEEPLDCPLYYVWIRDELRRINVADLPVEQKYVTLKAPLANRLNTKSDLAADIRHQNEYSRAGHMLGDHTEQTHPLLRSDERLSLVQGAMQGIAARGATFIEALAAPVEGHWVNPPRGSLAWELSQARSDQEVNELERACTHLDSAERMLQDATAFEKAEYWGLRGNWYVECGLDSEASSAYQCAYQLNPLPKYRAARVDAEIRLRFGTAPESLPELDELLCGDDPLLLATRSRLAALQGNCQVALQIAEKLTEPERSAAKAFAYWHVNDYAAVVMCCAPRLEEGDPLNSWQQLLLLLNARAKFALAHGTIFESDTVFIPASGLAGVDPDVLLDVWTAISTAVDALRKAGWKANIQYLTDIWAATALALGKGPSVLPLLMEATTARPELEALQEALRVVAADCGDLELSLRANTSLPPSETRSLWSALLNHQLGKYRLCVQSFQECHTDADCHHQWFGTAAVAAILSAQKMVQPQLVQRWLTTLESFPHLQSFAAQARYHIAVESNQAAKTQALRSLQADYEQLGRPHGLSLTLLQELDPTQSEDASTCVQLAERITQNSLLSPAMAARLGLALITLKDWPALLDLCQGGRVRAEAGDRMSAFEAVALDQLGQSDKARDRLAGLLASGSEDQVALNTYLTIATRCGYINEAIEAAERFLEVAGSRTQRLECLRLLYSLTYFAEPTSDRLCALAREVGELVDRNDEQEEGAYLAMRLTSTLGRADEDDAEEHDQFRQRLAVFVEKFPNSHILRRGEMREEWSAEELAAALKAMAGVTEESEALQRRLERGLQQGYTTVPYSWRPRFALSSVSDVVHLWELAKLSTRDDLKYHLTMIAGPTRAVQTAEALRARVPLLDLTALLILLDLELIDQVVAFFGTVAISRATLEQLADLASRFFGSPAHGKCTELQQALKPHLGSILQPSSPTRGRSVGNSVLRVGGRGNAEIAEICASRETDFRLYSDDFSFRIFCAAGLEPDGICTLDVLDGLAEVGLIDEREKAGKIAQLCRWNVGVMVRVEEFLTLVPPLTLAAENVQQGVRLLDADPDFTAVIAALWDYRRPFSKTLQHGAAVLHLLIGVELVPDITIAALMAQWFVKASMSKDAPDQALRTATLLIIHAGNMGPLENVLAARLWRILFLLAGWHQGYLDNPKVALVVRFLGVECAQVPDQGERLYSALSNCLGQGTIEATVFASAYSSALTQHKTRS